MKNATRSIAATVLAAGMVAVPMATSAQAAVSSLTIKNLVVKGGEDKVVRWTNDTGGKIEGRLTARCFSGQGVKVTLKRVSAGRAGRPNITNLGERKVPCNRPTLIRWNGVNKSWDISFTFENERGTDYSVNNVKFYSFG